MDQLYEDIGGLGKFQVFVIFGLLSTYGVSGWSIIQMSFSKIIPDWYCVINTPNQSNLMNQSWRINHTDALLSHLQAPFSSNDPGYVMNVSQKVCSINNIKCDAFWFDNPPYTIVSQWHLVCDLSWVPQVATSLQMFGILVGSLVSSQLGDQFGRKNLVYGTLLEHTLFNVIAGFSVSWEMFAVCIFFIGVGMGGYMSSILPYVLEFFPTTWFHRMSVIPFSLVGGVLFSGVAFLLQNWTQMQFGLAIFNAPFLLGWFFFPESPRWLAVHGRDDEALQVLGKMARINGKAVPDNAASVLKCIADTESKSRQNRKKYTYADLFRTRKSTRITCFMCFIWPSVSAIFFGLSISVSSLAGDVYLNLFLVNAAPIPLLLFILCIVNKTGIRPAVLALLLLCTAAEAGCIGATSTGEDMTVTMLALVSKMALSSAFKLVNIWSTELYPTVMRSTAFGLFHASAKIGSISSPYVINLDDRALVSYIIMAILSGICLVTTIGIPETKGTALADTMNAEVVVKTSDEEEVKLLHTSVEQQRYGLAESKGRRGC